MLSLQCEVNTNSETWWWRFCE